MSNKPKTSSSNPFKGMFKGKRHEHDSDSSSSDSEHRTPSRPKQPPCPAPTPHECPKPPPITINVNVECKGPGTGTGPTGGTGGVGGTGSTGGSGRPVHTTGTSDGSIQGGFGAPGSTIGIATRPPTVWPGTRTQCFVPTLFIRANAGDLSARPISGVFWESPDILILPGVPPTAAPNVPPDLGGIAKAGQDNTIYAHVWNIGQAPCFDATVEFYWFNPTMGFDGAHANFIGRTTIDLAGRGSKGSHKLVKCPRSWVAKFQNGGHECLLVRVFHIVSDKLSTPEWDASQNRHIGQRNIHVMSAAEAAAKPTLGINVGPMYGQPGQVAVDRAATNAMPWLHLATNSRTKIPGTGTATGDVGITAPIPIGNGLPKLGQVPDPRTAGLIGNSHGVQGDDQQVGFIATDANPGAGNAHVYRVVGSQNGTNVGGYTVVVLGS